MKTKSELMLGYLKLAILIGILYLPSYYFGGYASLKLIVFFIIVGTIYQSLQGTPLRRTLFASLSGAGVLAVYFLGGMQAVYLASVAIGAFFALACIGGLFELFRPKPGQGSLLTAMVVGLPIMAGLSYVLLSYGFTGLGWEFALLTQ